MSELATYALSTGHGSWPPTLPISGLFSNFQVSGRQLILANCTIYENHTNTQPVTHSGRTPTAGNSKFKFKGYSVCRVGDPINCGDAVGPNQVSAPFNIS